MITIWRLRQLREIWKKWGVFAKKISSKLTKNWKNRVNPDKMCMYILLYYIVCCKYTQIVHLLDTHGMGRCGTLYVTMWTQRFSYIKSWCNSGCVYVQIIHVSIWWLWGSCIFSETTKSMYGHWAHSHMHLSENISLFLGDFVSEKIQKCQFGVHMLRQQLYSIS